MYLNFVLFEGHARFTTLEGGDQSIFHFVDNRSIPLHKKFSFRVIPEGPVKVIFSKTKEQLNKTITFMIEMDETTVEGEGCNFSYSLKESTRKLELKSINEMEMIITRNEINFQDKIIINGSFDELNFIGFESVLPASWIVQKSRFLQVCYLIVCSYFSFAISYDWDR